MTADPSGVRVLRAKYLDWCSARLADRFLQLSPEEIYELATESSPAGPTDEGFAAFASEWQNSYRTIVGRVTNALAVKLDLPSFDEWAAAYQAAPAAFDDELLGLWKEGVTV